MLSIFGVSLVLYFINKILSGVKIFGLLYRASFLQILRDRDSARRGGLPFHAWFGKLVH
jgi:hypothetical protein